MKHAQVLLLAIALVACERPMRDDLQAHERHITIGPEQDVTGNYWGREVSDNFRDSQLTQMYQAMNSESTRARIRALNCGRTLTGHEYSVTLEEGPYGTDVRLQMTPRLYQNDECLQESVNFVFQQLVKKFDPGPPPNHGYKDPHTGRPLDEKHLYEWLPPQPACPCTGALKGLDRPV